MNLLEFENTKLLNQNIVIVGAELLEYFLGSEDTQNSWLKFIAKKNDGVDF